MIAKAQGFGKKWEAQWIVKSMTDASKTYKVSVAKDGRWACDCPAHRFAKAPKANCKHIERVRLSQEFSKITGAPMIGQTKAVDAAKKTGKVVVSLPNMLVIQTRREMYLEEDV